MKSSLMREQNDSKKNPAPDAHKILRAPSFPSAAA
jgi:hypothetical protein